jgi:hypothetical protein
LLLRKPRETLLPLSITSQRRKQVRLRQRRRSKWSGMCGCQHTYHQ